MGCRLAIMRVDAYLKTGLVTLISRALRHQLVPFHISVSLLTLAEFPTQSKKDLFNTTDRFLVLVLFSCFADGNLFPPTFYLTFPPIFFGTTRKVNGVEPDRTRCVIKRVFNMQFIGRRAVLINPRRFSTLFYAISFSRVQIIRYLNLKYRRKLMKKRFSLFTPEAFTFALHPIYLN